MKKKNEQGMALVTAMAAALIISVLAAVVLNMTWRRFEMSAFRSDRAIAGAEAEAAMRYAFARLDLDQAFHDRVVAKAPKAYVITCDAGIPPGQRDELIPELHQGAKVDPNGPVDPKVRYVGGKHVTVKIKYDPTDNGGAAQPYKVSAKATFGKGHETD